MKNALLAVVLLALFAACATGTRAPAPSPGSAPVLVTIVIDQFAGWIAAERLPLLPQDGGFARLRREGTWAIDMRFAHAMTETAPGHAALFTGALPRENRIYTNDVLGEEEAAALVRDPSTRLVEAGGATDRAGASLVRLRGETLADELHAADPRSRVVSLSIKDRGAIFGAGRHPDAVLWFDHVHDAFVTSTAFADRFPSWAVPMTDARALAARRAEPWTPLPDAGLAAAHALPDDAPGEGNYQGLGTIFPHDFAKPEKIGRAFRLSPASDALLLDLGIAAIDARRDPDQPMLLALSLSANDYVEHVFGPDSREAWDELERLDRELARFMDALDARLGPSGWSLVLAADHGANLLPETPLEARPWCGQPTADFYERPCAGGGRLDRKALLPKLREVAERTLGPGDWVAGFVPYLVFLTEQALQAPPEIRADLEDALRERLEAEPGIARVVSLDPYGAGPCPAGESDDALICNGTVLDDGAALYTVLRPGWGFDISMVPGFGENHGATLLYDRSVPLLVRAPGRAAAGRVLREPISFASFSKTAASILGIPAPGGDAGTDLAAPASD